MSFFDFWIGRGFDSGLIDYVALPLCFVLILVCVSILYCFGTLVVRLGHASLDSVCLLDFVIFVFDCG